jgi:sialidase-1
MQSEVLALRGVGGYRQYRIPAMAVSPSGRVFAIYDARPDLDDLPGPVDLVMRISDDHGLTWSEQKILRKSKGIAGHGDASILIDPLFGKFGRIIVLSQYTRLAGFFESSLGTDVNNPNIAQIEISTSDDDGITWNHKYITEQIKDEKTPGIFATSGTGSYIAKGKHAGRLLQTFVLRRSNELLTAVGFSDDHGETWQLSAELSGGNETAIAWMDNEEILLHSRATPFRLVSRSKDGGKRFLPFSPDLALPDPSDNGSLAFLSDGSLICTHNHDNSLRRMTVLKQSFDFGNTWSKALILEEESSAYSTSCELADGTIGVLYERNGYSEIVFAKISPSEITGNLEILNKKTDEIGVEFNFVLRYIRPTKLQILIETENKSPSSDLSSFKQHARKEIGEISEKYDATNLYTREELDEILGNPSQGIHLGDELRFSGKLAFHGTGKLRNVQIENFESGFQQETLEMISGDQVNFLDVRHMVTQSEIEQGSIRVNFNWSGEYISEQGEVKKVDGRVIKDFSILNGAVI